MLLGALARAAATSSLFPLFSEGSPQVCARSVFARFSLPGRPDHWVHFVVPATDCAAATASHSLGETTPTRLPFLTTSAVGNFVLSSAPTEISVAPNVAGRTLRERSIAGHA